MKRIKELLWVLWISLLVSLSSSCMGQDEVTKLREAVLKKLPIGTTSEQVRRVLTEEKCEYSWVEKDHAFYAVRRNVKAGALVKESISFIIYLDENQRVKEVKTKPVHTGP